MLARLIALVSLILVIGGCATSTAPGAVGVNRPQLMMVPSATINAEAAQGFSKLTSAAAQAGKLNNDAAMTVRVRDIAWRLIAQAKVYRPEAASWDWQVNVIDSEKVNAFCMPGGKIAVYSGLIRKLDLTDAELAAVVGHEIAHALREHSREKVSQKALSDVVVQALAMTGSRYAAVHSSAAQLGSILFVQLPYSREMELEADVMGLELMARAGYDPRAASGVWKKMQRLGGGSGIEFLATHPNPENRIAALETARPKVDPLYSAALASRTGTPRAQTAASATQPPASLANVPKVQAAVVATTERRAAADVTAAKGGPAEPRNAVALTDLNVAAVQPQGLPAVAAPETPSLNQSYEHSHCIVSDARVECGHVNFVECERARRVWPTTWPPGSSCVPRTALDMAVGAR